MDYKQIQELIKLVNKSNIGELSIEEKDFKIVIKQKEEKVYQAEALPHPAMQLPAYVQSSLPAAPQPAATAGESAAPKTDNLITIKSPMIGTFYKRPSPD